MTTTKVGYILALLLLPVLAACSPAASHPAPTAAEAAIATEAPPTATYTPEPTATPTKTPDPEVSFEELATIDPSQGTFIQDEVGNIIYNSPLFNTQVGKNIPVVQQYREVGLDGGPEIWIAPEKYPNAPILVQDLDTDEIRQGPFRYDNDVRRRLTLPNSGEFFIEEIMRGREGALVDINYVETKNVNVLRFFAASIFPIGELMDKDGHLVLPVKSYVGDAEDFLSLNFDLSLGPTYPENGPWDPFYSSYMGEEVRSYTLKYLVGGGGASFSSIIAHLEQILVIGVHDVSSKGSIPNNMYSPNKFYAYENAAESYELLDVLKNAGLPIELKAGVDYEDLSLYGAGDFITR